MTKICPRIDGFFPRQGSGRPCRFAILVYADLPRLLADERKADELQRAGVGIADLENDAQLGWVGKVRADARARDNGVASFWPAKLQVNSIKCSRSGNDARQTGHNSADCPQNRKHHAFPSPPFFIAGATQYVEAAA